MSGPIHNIRVDKIVGTSDPWSPASGKYTVWEWKVTGAIDNIQQDFILKTLAPTQASQVRDGWQGQAEEDERNGIMKYKIPKVERDQQGGSQAWNNAPPPPQQQQAPVQQQQAPRQQASQPSITQHTLGELASLMGECIDMIDGIFMVKDVNPEWKARAAIINTLFIEANRKGLRASVGGSTMNDPMKEKLMTVINAALSQMGLADRAALAGMGQDELIDMWTASEANEFTFAKNVNDALTAKGV